MFLQGGRFFCVDERVYVFVGGVLAFFVVFECVFCVILEGWLAFCFGVLCVFVCVCVCVCCRLACMYRLP